MNGLRPHQGIADARPLAPLLHRVRTDAVPTRERPYALFSPLYRSTASGLGDAPHLVRASPSVVRALPWRT
jgi:hypothetical protein